MKIVYSRHKRKKAVSTNIIIFGIFSFYYQKYGLAVTAYDFWLYSLSPGGHRFFLRTS